MLYLKLEVGSYTCVLDVRQIVDIVPLVPLRAAPHASKGFAGMLNYHGTCLPVFDLNALAIGYATMPRMGTRLVVVRGDEEDGEPVAALIAASADGTLRIDERTFMASGVGGEPWLGRVAPHGDDLVQLVDVRALLRLLLAPRNDPAVEPR